MGRNTTRRNVAVRIAAAAIFASLLAATAAGQAPLSLQQAVSMALENNPQRKMAVADQHAAEGGVKEARSALLPRVSFTESATRGNDPVYVFGTRLRQGALHHSRLLVEPAEHAHAHRQLQFALFRQLEPV